MNKKISVLDMEKIIGGDMVDSFCAGFGAVAGVYWIGVKLNAWNPVGQTAAVIGGAIGAGCAIKAIF